MNTKHTITTLLVTALCINSSMSQELDSSVHQADKSIIKKIQAATKHPKTKNAAIGATLTAAATAHPLGLLLGGVAGALLATDDDNGDKNTSQSNSNADTVSKPQKDTESLIRLTANVSNCNKTTKHVADSPFGRGSIASNKTTQSEPLNAFTLVSSSFTEQSNTPIKAVSLNRHVQPFCFYHQEEI